MIDKEKIRKEVERLKSQLLRGSCLEANCKEEAYNEVLAILDTLQEEPVGDKLVFEAIPRLLEMVGATDRAKAYTAKLADTLESEGYHTDAKIVRENIKLMNGEKVPMATMDKESVSEE